MSNYGKSRAARRVHNAGRAALLVRTQSCRGQSLIEFALVSMTFFLLAFALIDFSWLMFNQMNMQDAVREAARYAAAGAHLPNPNSPGVTLSRTASITQILNNSAAGTNCTPVISSAAGGVGSAGGPSDLVTISANCAIPTLTNTIGAIFGANGTYNFTVSSTFKNEPFPPSQTN